MCLSAGRSSRPQFSNTKIVLNLRCFIMDKSIEDENQNPKIFVLRVRETIINGDIDSNFWHGYRLQIGKFYSERMF